MQLGLCLQALYHLPFGEALRAAKDLGVEAVELPVDGSSPFVDLEAALSGGWRGIAREVEAAGLFISALSNHQEGQLLLGPHGEDTDGTFEGSAEEKARFAAKRLRQTAQLASLLKVGTVCAFTGCQDYSRWFPWPLSDGYERMAPTLQERLLPVLEAYREQGVGLALECHPRQFAYNLETALWVLELVENHPALGFNLDPANLLLAGMDPIVFVAELGHRILHVHAKDGEAVAHNLRRSGLLAHGSWQRPDRGFRFRIPGWGDIRWKALITELQLAGYRGVLAVEHEDPSMSQEEGLARAVQYLKPLILRDPAPEERWW